MSDRVAPASLAAARDALREGHAEGRTLLFEGARTALAFGPAQDVDRVVSTEGLARLLEHDPADMTARVEAGMPLGDLQRALGAHGQWLALDPPSEASTVGGLFARNEAGPRRLRYGSLRELVIGMTYVLPDGTVGRSGSRVIKNVAGFDLCKLFCGSEGSLGLVTELIVRLHPRPEERATVRAPATAAEATQAALALAASPLEASAADHLEGTFLLRFEGRGAGREAARAGALLAELGLAPDVLEGAEGDAPWRALRRRLRGRGESVRLRLGTLPSRYGELAEALDREAAVTEVELTLHSHVMLGLHTVELRSPEPRSFAPAVAALREAAERLGGHGTVLGAPPDLVLARHGSPPPAFVLMRRVKDALDPRGRCAPGRFLGAL